MTTGLILVYQPHNRWLNYTIKFGSYLTAGNSAFCVTVLSIHLLANHSIHSVHAVTLILV